MHIKNHEVYGLERAIVTSGYPMIADLDKWQPNMESRTKSACNLAKTRSGLGHDNFLKGIIVQFDLCLSLKAWTEAQRYHWLDFVSSQSTMHRITKMKIVECCNKYVWEETVQALQSACEYYNNLTDHSTDHAKETYLHILYNIPTGFELTAGMTTNYQQLKTIYQQRRNHRLPDWHMFCDWIETLPHSEWITGKYEPKAGNKDVK